MKNHAFLIIAHKQPKLLGRIVKLLEAENHYIFIHIDKRNKEIDRFKAEVNGISNVYFTQKRYEVHHAGISQIHAIIELLKSTKIYSNVSFDYFHTLSGQNYPLSANSIFNDFFENTDRSFMHIGKGELYNQLCTKIYKKHADELHFNNIYCLISKIYEKMRIGKFFSLIFKRKKIEGIYGEWDWFTRNKNASYNINEHVSFV